MKWIIRFLARIFSGYYSVIDRYGLEAVKVVYGIRYAVEQPVFVKATALTETTLDDEALIFLRDNIGFVEQLVQVLVNSNDCFKDAYTLDEQLFYLLKRISGINSKELKNFIWRNIARQHLVSNATPEALTNAGIFVNSDLNEVIERSLNTFKKKHDKQFSPIITYSAWRVPHLLNAAVPLNAPHDLLFDNLGQPKQTAKSLEWIYANRQVGWKCSNGKVVWYIRLDLNLYDITNARLFALSIQTDGRITKIAYK